MKCDYNNVFDKYKNYLYSYNYQKIGSIDDITKSQLPINSEKGYVELFVFTDRGLVPVEDAAITIYARKGEVNSEPIMVLMSQINPIKVELPVAHPNGTLIKGPEYYFTTYDLTIEKEGFYSITVKNIRIFPEITVQFNYNLNRILPGIPGKQETIAIPPHPLDITE